MTTVFFPADPIVIRLFPPSEPGRQTLTVNGRTYTASIGAPLDVQSVDADILEANGWVHIGRVGTTAQRPRVVRVGDNVGARDVATRGERFIDTTLGKMIVADYDTWRDPVTGSAV